MVKDMPEIPQVVEEDYELETERVLDLARRVQPNLTQVRKAVEALGAWLESQAARPSEPDSLE